MEEQTEEKTIAASKKKLEDARRKGQTSSSGDLISGVIILVVVAYLLLAFDVIGDRIVELAAAASTYHTVPFAEIAPRAIELAVRIVLIVSAPLVVIILFASIVSGMAGTFGPVFSFERIKPEFDRINPVQGIKKIFSLRNLMEFVKSVIKVAVLGAVLWLVLRAWLQPLFETPACGKGCLAPMTMQVVKVLALSAAAVFVIIGLADVILQRALFLREMRMTQTEFKREQKDLEGAPLLREERKRLRRDLSIMPRLSVKEATFLVVYGEQCLGVRYKRNVTPVPMIVCKGQGEKSAELIAQAQAFQIPVVEDAALIKGMAGKGGVGDMVPPRFFSDIARILVTHKLV